PLEVRAQPGLELAAGEVVGHCDDRGALVQRDRPGVRQPGALVRREAREYPGPGITEVRHRPGPDNTRLSSPGITVAAVRIRTPITLVLHRTGKFPTVAHTPIGTPVPTAEPCDPPLTAETCLPIAADGAVVVASGDELRR